MANRNLLIAVCVGIASSAVLGVALVEHIENRTLPLDLILPKTQYAVGESVTFAVKNIGSYPLVFPNSALGVSVTDSQGTVIWRPAYNDPLTIIDPKQQKTLTWNTADAPTGTYTIWSHVFAIRVSVTVDIV